VLATILALVLWWPFRDLPYDWDPAFFIVDNARDWRATHFWPLVPPRGDYAHPPLFVAMLASAWAIFGESRVVSHALEIPFFFGAVAGTYVLGRRVGGRLLGVAAALLFASTPVVVEEYAQVYVDLPLASLCACGLAAFFGEWFGLAGLFFALAAAVKIPSLVVPAGLTLATLARPSERRQVRRYIALAAPVAVVTLWLAYHNAITGWLLHRPGYGDTTAQDVSTFWRNALEVSRVLLLEQNRFFLLVGAALASTYLLVTRRDSLRADQRAERLVLVVALTIVFFAFAGVFGARYGLFALPPFIVAALYPVRLALRRATMFGAAVLLALAAFVVRWHPKQPLTSEYHFRPFDDLGAIDRIKVGRRAARYVRKHFPDAHVVGSFPESYELTEPWQGYVDTPVPFTECAAFRPEPSVTQLVYVHAYSPGQRACKHLVDALGARGIARVEENGKWVEIWALLPGD
jgi:4-amino-4-deoxy-L-arabinose transferase-like glycosyltransferase